jgi:nitric oxide reductase NorE protein
MPELELMPHAGSRNGPTPTAVPERKGHIPGEVGAWIFILGDMTIFGLLFGVYLDGRAADPGLFERSQQVLNRNFGVINTLLLLTSSLLVVVGVRAVRAGAPAIASRVFAGAIVCGLGFTLTKYLEWGHHLRHGHTPATNDFWMYYYVLTGLHFMHLVIGMGLLTALMRHCRRAVQTGRFGLIEGGACFWHMVDLLWIVLFPLLYLAH